MVAQRVFSSYWVTLTPRYRRRRLSRLWCIQHCGGVQLVTRSTATHVALTAHLLRQSSAWIGSTISRAPTDCVLLRMIHVGRHSAAQHQRRYDTIRRIHIFVHPKHSDSRQDHHRANSASLQPPPFPQIDIIGATVIVWRVREKIIRSVLCNIVCNNCTQCNAHTYEQT